ncbi:T9SS type A sorting domain-containing protein [Subsaximicrobium wynnwilliamsii]|uniref:T9SS type A sorting domain-containing protein n=1 Tax=Subsaximicrobium wynnwilliamsii TaxID=291179 RepID=A0A5C6ZCJ1_9FLAO|nr:T9SS type A sorting domain-containing protein [Subsaximicrobium wynnwilliamsii]TXD81836.1 T9SS type A sorting domain-containing protein [Subsaximicrobium wynnwilliamsii]TXD87505.1 T9SS type A sorting domain-containing protein [Subsaximicrobium wynnwilliamsii]TXE01188.1 T9SS type A sorting domain-containing protein [Subsaximicrobium wynnwilliamsii]
MIKHYALLLFALPFIAFSQTVAFESTISADLSAYSGATSFSGLGEYELFLDSNDGILDKPIILLDGFDPGDTRTISGIYDLLNFTDASGNQNLGDLVRAEGFDVVILNFPRYLRLADATLLNLSDVADTNGDSIIDESDFPAGSSLIDGGADFLERNAMLLLDLINTLNADKVGEEELVIIGPSMGGIISKYTLNYMENQSIAHETRLWISFDAPHLGANVPLGFQHQFNFLGFGLGNLNITQLQPVVNGLLKAPAARQMLIDQFETHLETGSNVAFDPAKLLPEAHPYKAIFDSSVNGLTATGFPQNTRNVAIVNGSGVGNPYLSSNGTEVTPGFTAIDDTFAVPGSPLPTTAQIGLNLTPASATGAALISKILVQINFIGTTTLVDVEANAQANSYSDGVDAASGGLFDLNAFTEGLGNDGIIGLFSNALQLDEFSFIPSVSAMAVEFPNNEIDWYDIDLGTPTSPNATTPFVNWHAPTENQPHVQLNEANVAFALSEILQGSLSNVSFENSADVRIASNPINDALVILSDKLLGRTNLSIIDITGKHVYKATNMVLTQRNRIPLDLESGMYILNIEPKNQTQIRIKFIVN